MTADEQIDSDKETIVMLFGLRHQYQVAKDLCRFGIKRLRRRISRKHFTPKRRST